MNKQQVEVGANKTGIGTSQSLAAEMVRGTEEFGPSSEGTELEFAAVRSTYSEQSEPLGSVPPPAMETEGESPESDVMLAQLLDKLGARLAFERSGVRLYSALISKFDAYGGFLGGPERADLENIRDEELEHFHTLSAAIEELGGDPTAITPGADLQATMSKGIMDVLVDPRTTFVQGLEAALLAELADNDCWTLLAQLAEQVGDEDLAADCEEAEAHEREHLARVRGWIAVASGVVPVP
jgi:rubrerythrin